MSLLSTNDVLILSQLNKLQIIDMIGVHKLSIWKIINFPQYQVTNLLFYSKVFSFCLPSHVPATTKVLLACFSTVPGVKVPYRNPKITSA